MSEVYTFKVVFQYGVAVRISPAIDAEKTGEIIPYGTILESNKSLVLDGINYVKLMDGRGWIFSTKGGVKVLDLIEVTRCASSSSFSSSFFTSPVSSVDNLSALIDPVSPRCEESECDDLPFKPRKNLAHLLVSPQGNRTRSTQLWREIRNCVRSCGSFADFSSLVLRGLPLELQPPAIPEPGPARSAWMASSDADQMLRVRISILAAITRQCAGVIADVGGLEAHLWVVTHLGACDFSHVLRLFDNAALVRFEELRMEHRLAVLAKLNELTVSVKVHTAELGRQVDMLPDDLRHILQRWVMIKILDEQKPCGSSPNTPTSSSSSSSSVQKQAVAAAAAASPTKPSTPSSSSSSSYRREMSFERESSAGHMWLSVITACTNPIIDDCDEYSDPLPRKPFFRIAQFVSEVSAFAKNLATDPDYQLANVI